MRRTRLSSIFSIDRRTLIAAGVMLLVFSPIATGIMYDRSNHIPVDPAAYASLLNTIAKGESNGNYNAHYSNSSNTTVLFTEMSVAEVMKWQADFVAGGNPSNAVGKYQFMGPTLRGLVQKLDIDTKAKFNSQLQDRLAIALLEKRGALEFVENKLSRQQFAHNLSKEWAALPKAVEPNPDQSYYAGDGLNEVQVTIHEVYTALGILKGYTEA